MVCRNCGKEIKDSDVFCRHCGTKQNDNKDQNVEQGKKEKDTSFEQQPENKNEKLNIIEELPQIDLSLIGEDIPKKFYTKKIWKNIIWVLIVIMIIASSALYLYFYGIGHGTVRITHFGKEAYFDKSKDSIVQAINETINNTTDWVAVYPDMPEKQKADYNQSFNNDKKNMILKEENCEQSTKSDVETLYTYTPQKEQANITITTNTKSGKVTEIAVNYSDQKRLGMSGASYRCWQYLLTQTVSPNEDLAALYTNLETLGDPLHNYRNSKVKETTNQYVKYTEKGISQNLSGLMLQFSLTPSFVAADNSKTVEKAPVATVLNEKALTQQEAIGKLNGSWTTEDFHTFITRYTFVEGHMTYVYESYQVKGNWLYFKADLKLINTEGNTANFELTNLYNKGITMDPRYDKPMDIKTLKVDFTQTEDGAITINDEKVRQTEPAK